MDGILWGEWQFNVGLEDIMLLFIVVFAFHLPKFSTPTWGELCPRIHSDKLAFLWLDDLLQDCSNSIALAMELL